MTQPPENSSLITTKVRIRPEFKTVFVDWQAKFHEAIADARGFVSLEIQSPPDATQFEWVIVQRFENTHAVSLWCESKERKELFYQLKKIVAEGHDSFQDTGINTLSTQGVVTEVFVTLVSPENETVYREWIAKMHQVEASFPGFKGVYVQSPSRGKGGNWITLLQFDTPENLDRWLSSPERKKILKEGEQMISSIDAHRVISPFAGWFASLAKAGKGLPPVWKQTMVILLVLFPIVMLELKFLMPWLTDLNHSLSTFIGNAISVTLVSWPMMPISIWFLGWWLSPKDEKNRTRVNIVGTLIVVALYLIEIAALWFLL